MTYQMLLPPCGKAITTNSVAVTASSTASSAFSSQTRIIRVQGNMNACYLIGASPTALASHAYLPAHAVEYIKVNPGEKIATIQAPSDGLDTAGTGSITVTELTA